MNDVKALCFDVFGTVVDWRRGVARDVQAFAKTHGLDIDPEPFADAWRARYQPAMQACREGQRPYTPLDTLHRENLERVLADHGVPAASLGPESLDWLNKAWHRLDPWPDAVQGLARLKSRYILATASNGNIALMVNMAKRAGLPWDVILGADVTRAYKPAAEAYDRMAEVLGLAPSELCMVAAHNDDLKAARQRGLATAFVARRAEHGSGQTKDLTPAADWDIVSDDFNDLASQLGC